MINRMFEPYLKAFYKICISVMRVRTGSAVHENTAAAFGAGGGGPSTVYSSP
jgi:hypothetical protein